MKTRLAACCAVALATVVGMAGIVAVPAGALAATGRLHVLQPEGDATQDVAFMLELDSALAAGRSFRDPVTGITITEVTVGYGGAMVDVNRL